MVEYDGTGTKRRKNFHNPLGPHRNHGLLPLWARLMAQWAGGAWNELSPEDKQTWEEGKFTDYTAYDPEDTRPENFITRAMWDHVSEVPQRTTRFAIDYNPVTHQYSEEVSRTSTSITIAAIRYHVADPATDMWCSKLYRYPPNRYRNFRDLIAIEPWYSQELMDMYENGSYGDHCTVCSMEDLMPIAGAWKYDICLYFKPMRLDPAMAFATTQWP